MLWQLRTTLWAISSPRDNYAMDGVQIWRSGGAPSHPEDVDTPVVGTFCYKAGSEWHLGEIASCHATMDEAISLAKELKDMHALGLALFYAAVLGYCDLVPLKWNTWHRN